MLVGLACLVLSVAAELAQPLVWKYVIDVGLVRRDWGYILGMLALLVGLLAAPRLLLLDEPTSAVDPESESLIVDALAALPHSLTTITMTHRVSLARAADRVVVLEAGRIVEDGLPADLASRADGRFAALARDEWVLAGVSALA